MDQPPAVASTAFADAWPTAIETEIGAALCAIGAGRTLTFFTFIREVKHVLRKRWVYQQGAFPMACFTMFSTPNLLPFCCLCIKQLQFDVQLSFVF